MKYTTINTDKISELSKIIKERASEEAKKKNKIIEVHFKGLKFYLRNEPKTPLERQRAYLKRK